MTASESTLDLTKSFSNVFKASYQKEFVLFSFFYDLLTANSGKFLSTSKNLLLSDPGLGGNKMVLVQNIVRHFYLSCFRRVVNSTLDGTFLLVCYKKRISQGVCFNRTQINCILIIFLSLAAIFHLSKS